MCYFYHAFNCMWAHLISLKVGTVFPEHTAEWEGSPSACRVNKMQTGKNTNRMNIKMEGRNAGGSFRNIPNADTHVSKLGF